ncbi:iron ABC transporter permease [Microbulbifer sp. OS29]|uniref:Iron ABC transporter permease n=1 Tax=Microbulbifer okhotskensis TaxID=2926617 RepID=A0A9X2EVC3_9GAMM|nr:iron chelate uptake ABC transporter family permease subunit [Microbulbifer okhotskensis]MCO1336153.1 iron ABC transporter permease [Microbulbifer okhotskensis]
MTVARIKAVNLAWWILPVLLAVSFVAAVAVGAVYLSPWQVFAALGGQDDGGLAKDIVQAIRLPRALLAAGVGAVLAVCGAMLQGLFRNPLADPSLIGVTAGASFGACLAILLGAEVAEIFGSLPMVSMAAFCGGLLAVALVYKVAKSVNGTSVATMLLMGIAVAAFSGSLIGLMEYFADNDTLRRISLWLMGGLDAASYPHAFLIFAVLCGLLASMPRFGLSLNVLLLGESQARHLGVDVERVKTTLIVLVAAGVGTSVAVAGSIAFVGLVIPHMVRLWVGPDHRQLLPLSALAGASLLLVSDTLARTIIAPVELPVGLITALIGVPFFVSLLHKSRGSH